MLSVVDPLIALRYNPPRIGRKLGDGWTINRVGASQPRGIAEISCESDAAQTVGQERLRLRRHCFRRPASPYTALGAGPGGCRLCALFAHLRLRLPDQRFGRYRE